MPNPLPVESCSKCPHGPLKQRFNGGQGDLHRLGNLIVTHLFISSQQQCFALSLGQFQNLRLHEMLQVLPDQLMFLSRRGRRELMFLGIEPNPSKEFPSAQITPGRIAGNPEEPAAKLPAPSIATRVPIHSQKDVLREIARIFSIAHHS